MAEIEGPSQRIDQPVMETVRPLIIHIYRSAPDRTLLPRYLIERLIMISAMRALNLLNLVMSFEERRELKKRSSCRMKKIRLCDFFLNEYI